MTFIFVASPINTQHKGERAKTDWLRIGKMCPSGSTSLSTGGQLLQ
jgi:hypothetical protein